MKSASEVRALMDKDNSKISRITAMLEKDIVKAAKSGYDHVVVFVPTETCSFNCARNIKGQMVGLGYECKIDYIADQRDGNCIKFFIEW